METGLRAVETTLVTGRASVLGMSAVGRGQRRLTGNLVGSPAPDRMSVGTRFKRWPRLTMTHGFGVTAARTERTSVRRIERIGKLALCRRERRAAQRIGNGGDEGLRIRVCRPFEDFAPAACLHDAAEIHDGNPVAHVLDDTEVVADHDVGEAKRFLQFQQQVDDLGTDRDVQRRYRFVADDNPGIEDQRASDANALTLAAREFMRIAAGLFGPQPYMPEHRRNASVDLAF